MKQYLNTLFLKVHIHTNQYACNSIIRILIKILYQENCPMSKKELVAHKVFCDTKINSDIWQVVFDELGKLSGISLHKGKFNLTASYRKQIDSLEQEAINRNQRIIQKYFGKLFTPIKQIEFWLSDISQVFFEQFSNDWLADLIPSNNHKMVDEKIIKELIVRRTSYNEEIDNRDREELVNRYYSFITAQDNDVYGYLWDYGTSIFAAKLITNQVGVDSFTIDAFKDSIAVFDTNILLFLALEASPKHNAILQLVDVFKKLHIQPMILPITIEEYHNKVDSVAETTMHNIENFTYGTATSAPNDDFTNSARMMGCRKLEDFQTFFSELRKLPDFGDESIAINNETNCAALIMSANSNEAKHLEVNSIYKNITGKDKRPASLNHDVCLLDCVENLKDTKKMFILSEEVGVIGYAQQRPLQLQLPLAIRLTTLVTMFANSNVVTNAEDYKPLFASLLRYCLFPTHAFTQEDLQTLFLINQDIAVLPEETATKIAYRMHEMRMLGANESEVAVHLAKAITGGRLSVTDALLSTEEELNKLRADHNTQQEEMKRMRKSLYNLSVKEYDDETKRIKRRSYIVIPIVLLILSLVLFVILYKTKTIDCNKFTIIVSIVVNFLTDLVISLIQRFGKIKKREQNRDMGIDAIYLQKTQSINNNI